jgi:hypothetical protein
MVGGGSPAPAPPTASPPPMLAGGGDSIGDVYGGEAADDDDAPPEDDAPPIPGVELTRSDLTFKPVPTHPRQPSSSEIPTSSASSPYAEDAAIGTELAVDMYGNVLCDETDDSVGAMHEAVAVKVRAGDNVACIFTICRLQFSIAYFSSSPHFCFHQTSHKVCFCYKALRSPSSYARKLICNSCPPSPLCIPPFHPCLHLLSSSPA